MFKQNLEVVNAFIQGKPKKRNNDQSTGNALYLYGNKITEWKNGVLHISNGSFTESRGSTGSATTKVRLNALPNVCISQKRHQWYLNGVKWDGEWVVIEGSVAPPIDNNVKDDVFVLETEYIHTDGWRGYSQPKYAVCGANDTGSWSDSPCPTRIATSELNTVKTLLKRANIPVKEVVCETSNVFCIHRYLVPKLKDVELAKTLVKEFLASNETDLLYAV